MHGGQAVHHYSTCRNTLRIRPPQVKNLHDLWPKVTSLLQLRQCFDTPHRTRPAPGVYDQAECGFAGGNQGVPRRQGAERAQRVFSINMRAPVVILRKLRNVPMYAVHEAGQHWPARCARLLPRPGPHHAVRQSLLNGHVGGTTRGSRVVERLRGADAELQVPPRPRWGTAGVSSQRCGRGCGSRATAPTARPGPPATHRTRRERCEPGRSPPRSPAPTPQSGPAHRPGRPPAPPR